MLSTVIFILSGLAFLFGAFIAISNIYLGYLREPIYRWRKLPKQKYRNVSGIPLIGSLFLGLSWLGLQTIPGVSAVIVILIVLDPVGIFSAMMVLVFLPLIALFYRR